MWNKLLLYLLDDYDVEKAVNDLKSIAHDNNVHLWQTYGHFHQDINLTKW